MSPIYPKSCVISFALNLFTIYFVFDFHTQKLNAYSNYFHPKFKVDFYFYLHCKNTNKCKLKQIKYVFLKVAININERERYWVLIYLNNLSWQELIQLFYLNFVCKLILMQTRINQVFHIFTTQILNAAFRVKLSHWQWPSDNRSNEMCFQFAWRLIQIHKSGKSI